MVAVHAAHGPNVAPYPLTHSIHKPISDLYTRQYGSLPILHEPDCNRYPAEHWLHVDESVPHYIQLAVAHGIQVFNDTP